jgi:hypothetical protein
MLVHRAYTDTLRITPEDAHWIFDQVVFFVAVEDGADDIDAVEASYTQGNADHVYALDINHDWIDAADLVADAVATTEIRKLWGRATDAQELIDGTDDGTDDDGEDRIEDSGWHIQRLQAQQARRMGYHAVRGRDEQGEVYAVDFTDRNDELNAAWRYLGRYSELAQEPS